MATSVPTAPPSAAPGRLLSWLVGAALLGALALLLTQREAEQQLVAALAQARPGWLAVGALLQAGTYVADARIWAGVLARAGEPRPFGRLVRQSVAKLFVDQALPSAGVSGTVLVVGALGRTGVSHATCAAALVVRLVTHFLAYGLLLALALGLARGRLPPLLLAPPALFALGLVAGALGLVRALGRPAPPRLPARLGRLRAVRAALETARAASPRLVHDRGLLGRALALQAAVHVLDAATLWAALAAVGAPAGPREAFVGMMLASAVRSAGGVPGGLGTFEAACTGVLAGLGVPLAPALLATLVFRGLSLWLPLAPGALLARRLARGA